VAVVSFEINNQYIQLTSDTNKRSIESKKPGATNLFIDIKDKSYTIHDFFTFIPCAYTCLWMSNIFSYALHPCLFISYICWRSDNWPIESFVCHLEIILSMAWLLLRPPNFQMLYFFLFDHMLTTRLRQL